VYLVGLQMYYLTVLPFFYYSSYWYCLIMPGSGPKGVEYRQLEVLFSAALVVYLLVNYY
jgi:hypothetical protein